MRAIAKGEKIDSKEAAERAAALAADPKVRAWMRRVRKLMKELPKDVWIYWQEDSLYLMALGPEGEHYMDGNSTDQAAIRGT